ncbi:hypothetical protein MKX01_003700, partial [Papaver californicum]
NPRIREKVDDLQEKDALDLDDARGCAVRQYIILCRTSSEENYTFTVGYHELSGTQMKLKKPYLVLKKKRTILKSILDAEEDINEANSPKIETELEVFGIIRHRILFKTRSKPLISI